MAEEWKSWPRRQRIIQELDELLKQTSDPIKKSGQELESSLYKRSSGRKEEYLSNVSKIIMFLKDKAPQNSNQTSSNLTAMLANQASNASSQPNVNMGISVGQMTVTSSVNQTASTMANQTQMVHSISGPGNVQIAHGNTSGGQVIHSGVSGVGQQAGVVGGMGPGQIRMSQGINNPMVNQNDMVNWQGAQAKGRRNPEMIMMNMNKGQHPGMSNMSQIGNQQAKMQTMSMTGDQSLNNMIVGVGQMNAPSPSGMIHTPLSQNTQQQQQPSPLPQTAMNQEERAYMEKVHHLQTKYLDTLRGVAKKIGNNDPEHARKVRNLLEILENPQKRASMEMLRKCEQVLEKIDSQQRETRGESESKPQSKDNPVSVLFDAVAFALKSPKGQNTIYRTLAPALCTLNGPELDPVVTMRMKRSSPSPPPTNQDGPIISDAIQGEVACLPPRFKVNLECPQGPGRDDITLSCQLDDPNLPCVPPITVTLPPNYPACPPQALVPHYDYSSTPFLQKVKQVMKERQFHLPEVCSLTMVLELWEMSVRQACCKNSFSASTLANLIHS